MSKLIYLDNAATTQVYPEVLQEIASIFFRSIQQSICNLQFLHLRAKRRLIKQGLPWQN